MLYRHHKIFTFILIRDIVYRSRCHGIITLSVIDGVPNIFFPTETPMVVQMLHSFHVLTLQVQKKDTKIRPKLDYVVIHSKVLSPTEVVANFKLNNGYYVSIEESAVG